MATPFFGKRDNEIPTTGARPATASSSYTGPGSTTVTSAPHAASQGPSHHNMARVQGGDSATAASHEGGSTLTVGPNIKLKGVEITDCDTLVVEGTVEATMNSRLIQIAEQGAFRGSAEIEIAEIRGEFNGNLTVRQKLVIYATGKVSGTIRYGKLVVEEGGQLSGEIVFGTQGAGHAGAGGAAGNAAGNSRPAVVVKPGLQAA